MVFWLRRLFAPSTAEVLARLDSIERDFREWEVMMTGLTDKLSSQLKRLGARHSSSPMNEAVRQAELNEAIRARRRARVLPLNGDS